MDLQDKVLGLPHVRWIETPLGAGVGLADTVGITGFYFADDPDLSQILAASALIQSALVRTHLDNLADWLARYFAGERVSPAALPLHFKGTPFQMQCWQALCHIPYGQTWHYQQQALFIGNPKAVRAVGSANGRNPISIIVPCHRVVGKTGLGGYTGGLWRKSALLQLETQALRAL